MGAIGPANGPIFSLSKNLNIWAAYNLFIYGSNSVNRGVEPK